MKVIGLNIHPLKSGRAIPREIVDIDRDGLRGDRRFMLVDLDGQFITQRELQSLAQVEAAHVPNGVSLTMGGRKLTVTFDPANRMDVRVWSSAVNAAVAADPPRPSTAAPPYNHAGEKPVAMIAKAAAASVAPTTAVTASP